MRTDVRIGLVLAVALAAPFASTAGHAQPPISVGPQVRLDAPIASASSSRAQTTRIACTATVCLVVWSETGTPNDYVRSARIRASDGAILDPIAL